MKKTCSGITIFSPEIVTGSFFFKILNKMYKPKIFLHCQHVLLLLMKNVISKKKRRDKTEDAYHLILFHRECACIITVPRHF
jgi:predicted nucleic acid-binding protein